jgi:phosphoribosylformimino-5-aminoimidazole carboxamide ribotide isomerase
MRILPVLDLLGGLVVRGVAGRRSQYRPIVSPLAADPRPGTVARAFVERLGLRECYVADLDAIAGAEPAWAVYRELTERGLRLWIDAGTADVPRAAALARFEHAGRRLARVVAGLETVPDEQALQAIAGAVGEERLSFSLDLRDGHPLTSSPGWAGRGPIEIAAVAVAAGARSLIVLDLARVGVGGGVGTEPLCHELHARWPHVELVAGGGVRSIADVKSLAAAGCHAALVASVLHDGIITAEDIAALAMSSDAGSGPH